MDETYARRVDAWIENLRDAPDDEGYWATFADWLEDHGDFRHLHLRSWIAIHDAVFKAAQGWEQDKRQRRGKDRDRSFQAAYDRCSTPLRQFASDRARSSAFLHACARWMPSLRHGRSARISVPVVLTYDCLFAATDLKRFAMGTLLRTLGLATEHQALFDLYAVAKHQVALENKLAEDAIRESPAGDDAVRNAGVRNRRSASARDYLLAAYNHVDDGNLCSAITSLANANAELGGHRGHGSEVGVSSVSWIADVALPAALPVLNNWYAVRGPRGG